MMKQMPAVNMVVLRPHFLHACRPHFHTWVLMPGLGACMRHQTVLVISIARQVIGKNIKEVWQ